MANNKQPIVIEIPSKTINNPFQAVRIKELIRQIFLTFLHKPRTPAELVNLIQIEP